MVVPHRLEPELLLGTSGDRVQRRVDVAPSLPLPHLCDSLFGRAEDVDRAGGFDDAWSQLLVLLRQVVLECHRVLDQMVVHRDDLHVRLEWHGPPLSAGACGYRWPEGKDYITALVALSSVIASQS
jgi:hypothetical protein